MVVRNVGICNTVLVSCEHYNEKPQLSVYLYFVFKRHGSCEGHFGTFCVSYHVILLTYILLRGVCVGLGRK